LKRRFAEQAAVSSGREIWQQESQIVYFATYAKGKQLKGVTVFVESNGNVKTWFATKPSGLNVARHGKRIYKKL